MISTPFYKIVYLNPQTIPDILQIKPSRCLFAVGYLKPYQILDACRCKKPFVRNRIPGFSGHP